MKVSSVRRIDVSYARYIFLAFELLYMPSIKPFLGISSLAMLTIIYFPTLIRLMTKNRAVVIAILRNKIAIFSVFLLFLANFYVFARAIIGGVDGIVAIKGLLQGLMPIYYGLLSVGLISEMMLKDNYPRKKIIKVFLMAAIVQSVIAILMFLIPSFKNIAITIFNYENQKDNYYIARSRLYGLCDGDYTYGLQILSAALAITAFIYAFRENERRYYAVSALILIVTVLNGRTGILIYAIVVLLFMTKKLLTRRKFLKTAGVLLAVMVVGTVAVGLIKKIAPNNYIIIESAIEDFRDESGGKNGTETGRFKEMYFAPMGKDLIFGRGYRVIGKRGVRYGTPNSSDVGFVNDLFLGGVIYVALITLFFYCQTKIAKSGNIPIEYTFAMIAIFVLANFKGEAMRQPLLVSGMFTYFVYCLLVAIKENNNEKKQSINNRASI